MIKLSKQPSSLTVQLIRIQPNKCSCNSGQMQELCPIINANEIREVYYHSFSIDMIPMQHKGSVALKITLGLRLWDSNAECAKSRP